MTELDLSLDRVRALLHLLFIGDSEQGVSLALRDEDEKKAREITALLPEVVSLWPDAPDLVLALHACGRASDDILDVSSRMNARVLRPRAALRRGIGRERLSSRSATMRAPGVVTHRDVSTSRHPACARARECASSTLASVPSLCLASARASRELA